MNIKMLIIGVLATITVIIVGVISAFMVINSEAPTAKQVMVSSTEDNNKTEKKKNLMDGKKKKEREIIVKKIKQGIQATEKKMEEDLIYLIKMTDELRKDIKLFLNDRNIKQIDLMKKHNINGNTLKKYIQKVKEA